MLYLKFKIMMLNNDDANDDENAIDIFSRTEKYRTYEIPERKQSVHHESIRIANYSFSSTLSCNTLLFISASIGYFAQESYLER